MSTRLCGFGRTITPSAPFRIERIAGGPPTRLRVWGPEGSVDLDALGTSDVLAITPGPERDQWRIETEAITCAWPEGLALSSDPDGLSPFLLVGPGESMIWFSGPIARERAWPIESLAGEGQKVRAVADTREGDARLDLDYLEEGELWWQRRFVRAWGGDRVLVLSAQARAADEELVRAAVDLVDATLARAEQPS